MDLCEQADVLRRELLEHYFTSSPMKPAASSRRGAPSQQVASPIGDRGSLILSRADMTLHDIQVSLALYRFSIDFRCYCCVCLKNVNCQSAVNLQGSMYLLSFGFKS
jgi:hypothetical protein